MQRLNHDSPPQRGDAWVDLRFEHREGEAPSIRGEVSACLSFVCQRCLEPVDISVESTVDLALRHKDAPPTQDDDQDWLQLGEGSVLLRELVEDELILALPIIPLHEQGQCEFYEPPSSPSKPHQSPFSLLSTWKKS